MAEPNVFTIIKNLSTTKDGFFDPSLYNTFIVNRAFGHFPDTVLIAQELNTRSNLTKQQHYDFLFHTIRKKKRFAPWPKTKEDEDILTVQEFYNISRQKAIDAMKILNENQLEFIRQKMSLGGINTNRSTK